MIFLIDGHSIAFRAFYALPETLTTKDGFPTNVIHGFLMMISKLVNNYDVEQIIITWDVSKKTFRNEIYDQYKANRSSSPDNFKIQIKELQNLLSNFNIPQISLEGYEADDVLGSLSYSFNKQNKKVTIVTGDRDSFQLINSKTKIMYTKRGISDVEIYDNRAFTNKYQISTSQYVEYLALKGDKSDNIPGLPGVGEKTAISLLQKYKNISNIYKNLEELTPKLQSNFIDNKKQLMMSKDLAKIKTDLDLQIPSIDLKETVFFDNKILVQTKDDIIKYELNRFLGEREMASKDKIEKIDLQIERKNENIDNRSIVFIFDNKNYFVNEREYGEFDSLTIFKEVISLTSQDLFNTHSNIDTNNTDQLSTIIKSLKIMYEDYWKNFNQINTSIKLPLLIRVNNRNFNTSLKFEKVLFKCKFCYTCRCLYCLKDTLKFGKPSFPSCSIYISKFLIWIF